MEVRCVHCGGINQIVVGSRDEMIELLQNLLDEKEGEMKANGIKICALEGCDRQFSVGTVIPGLPRADTKYCSNAHKQKAYRLRKAAAPK
jgi:hypothetical protein